jgi:hypothetical protein
LSAKNVETMVTRTMASLNAQQAKALADRISGIPVY